MMSYNNPIVLFFLSLFIWVFGPAFAQERGFLTVCPDEDHSWFVTDALETSEGCFVVCASDSWGDNSMLLKISSEGDVLGRTIIAAQDTAVFVRACLPVTYKTSREVIALCPCHPNDGNTAALVLFRVDEDLNIVYKKTISCPFLDPGSRFYETKFMLSDSCIYGALTTTSSGGMPEAIILVKIDFDGNLLNYRSWGMDTIRAVGNLFHAEEGRIGLFGQFDSSHMGLLTIDSSLQPVRRDTIFQWSAPEGNNGDFCHYYIHDRINSHAAMLPDGSHVVSARMTESLYNANGYPYNVHDQSAIFARYVDDFHQPDEYIITEHLNGSVEYPAFFRSVDVREADQTECGVFQCTNLHELPQYGLMQPYPTGVAVTKTNQDLSVEWGKRYLEDDNYQAMVICATSDGGCLVAGSLGEFQTQRFDAFALKINADGTVGVDEIQEESLAFVYPNPARDVIRIEGVEARETRVYNALGQQVMSFKGNETNAGTLTDGIYLLKITDSEGHIQTLRLVVNK